MPIPRPLCFMIMPYGRKPTQAEAGRGPADWLRPTLLAGAFDLGDADKAEELCDEVAEEGPALWQIDSVVHDLERSVAQVED